MNLKKYIFSVYLILVASTALATEVCSTMLDYGVRDNFSVMTSDDRFSLYQSALCNEEFSTYDSFASTVKDHNLSFRTAKAILGLSGSSKRIRNNFSQAYSKFCKSDLSVNDTRSRFMRKTSVINNELARAFNECVRTVSRHMADEKLNLYIDVTPQSDFRNFTVRVTRNSSSTTKITNISPSTVGCSAGGRKIKIPHTISTNKFTLECRKPIKSIVSFQINTSGEGYSNEVTLPAEKDRLHEVESRIEALEELVSAASPKKIVITVAENSCPDGWEPFVPAYGRFVRGIDKSGTNIDPDGKREHSTPQKHSLASHSHTQMYGDVKGHFSPSGWETVPHVTKGGSGGVNTGSFGDKETRPKNVSLLFCAKIKS